METTYTLQIRHISANRIEELFIFAESLELLYNKVEILGNICMKGFTLWFPNGIQKGSNHPVNAYADLYNCLEVH